MQLNCLPAGRQGASSRYTSGFRFAQQGMMIPNHRGTSYQNLLLVYNIIYKTNIAEV